MKIYRLTVNEIGPTPSIIAGDFRADRTKKKVLYYAQASTAYSQQKRMMEAATELLGWMPKVEFIVDEIEVIE